MVFPSLEKPDSLPSPCDLHAQISGSHLSVTVRQEAVYCYFHTAVARLWVKFP